MINCSKCGKDNQDHYKFCLGCGAELTRGEEAKSFSPGTPPHGMPQGAPDGAAATALAMDPSMGMPRHAYGAMAQPGYSAAAMAPTPQPMHAVHPDAAPAAASMVDCPQCTHPNPEGNRFCASCGYNLGALQAAAPARAPAAAPQAMASAVRHIVLTALRADGSEAGNYTLPDSPMLQVGRDTGSIFAGDSYLSPRHAVFTRTAAGLAVKDEGSLNGVYIRLQPDAPCRLEFGSVFRIGQEIIRFDALEPAPPAGDGVRRLGSPGGGFVGRLSLVIGRDTTGNSFPVPKTGLHCGRERGDVLFSEDGYVSGLHCRVAPAQDGAVYLTDVGSSNGTFIRLMEERQLEPGDILLMGQQLFRVDM